MWHKPCRTFHPWCLCIKTRCLCVTVMPCLWSSMPMEVAEVEQWASNRQHGGSGSRQRLAHAPYYTLEWWCFSNWVFPCFPLCSCTTNQPFSQPVIINKVSAVFQHCTCNTRYICIYGRTIKQNVPAHKPVMIEQNAYMTISNAFSWMKTVMFLIPFPLKFISNGPIDMKK